MKLSVKKWSDSSLWGSWNRQRINSVMRQRTLSEVRIGVLRKRDGLFSDNFTWVGISGNSSLDYYDFKGVYKTDYHSVSGDYSKIGLYMYDFKFDLEFACNGDDFVYKIIPRTLSNDYEIFIGFLQGAQKDSFDGKNIELTDYGCKFNSAEGQIEITIDGDKSETHADRPYAGMFFKVDGCLYIKCNNNRNKHEADKFLHHARTEYLKSRVYGEGFLGDDAVESVIKALAWNKVYDNVNDTFKSDVTRLWTPNSCYYTFYWDNFFTSLIYGLEDEKMAYDQVDSVCSEFKNGYLPQCAWEWGSSNMINPPVGSFCLLKLYRQFGDKDLLENYYDRLYSTNTYLLEKKSWEKNGLLQLKDKPDLDEMGTFNEILGTGLDNSPMYDDAKEGNLNDIGMSSIYALDCLMLAQIADILGKSQDKEILVNRYTTVKDAINEKLWDEKNGIYCNTTLDGKYCDIYSPTSFYPMIAGVATKERAQRLVSEHLLNEEEFWGEYVIPSISKKHPSFHEQEYWRGCAWPPMNLIVYEGLKMYNYYDIAHGLARKSLDMYMKNWKDFGWVLENFNTKTGGITKNCAPMYTWGGLMVYMAVEEVFEVLPTGGLKFGNLNNEYGEIKNLRVGRDLYNVITGESLKVYKNNELLIETDVMAMIKDFIIEDATCRMEIVAEREGKCIIRSNVTKIEVKTGSETKTSVSTDGVAEIYFNSTL